MEATSNDTTPLVQVENLSRRYGDTLAVDQVSFTLKKGEVLGFLGPNGAGKSSSMQMITGNLAPTTGQITINGFDMIDQPIQAKSCIGYLPENPPVYRDLTVDEFLTYCSRLHRIPSAGLNSALDTAKQHCGLEDVGKRLIGNLSKGFQQRVGIAQAIIHQPPLVILDEPTVGLDPIQVREIRKLIQSLGKDRSVILSTHILPEVQATCGRVQIIRKGALIYSSSIEELNQQGQTNNLTVAFKTPPGLQELSDLTGVNHITEMDHLRFNIQFENDNFAESLVQQAVSKNWGLFELIPQNTSLEEIFVELTTSEAGDQETQENAA